MSQTQNQTGRRARQALTLNTLYMFTRETVHPTTYRNVVYYHLDSLSSPVMTLYVGQERRVEQITLRPSHIGFYLKREVDAAQGK